MGSHVPPEHIPTIEIDDHASSYAWLVMLRGPRRGRLYPLKPEGVSLGRGEANDICLDDESVSRFHARIVAEPGPSGLQFIVQDLASVNGTFVNGERITRQALKDEDRLQLGNTVLVFKQL
ncbi:MAG: FHA domain-containing protein [Chloroflexi bacterium]|nr:FHA domain-containing protein [Chloroflexota bacterium]